MRLIDADELQKCFSLALHGREVYNAEEILMTIQTAPTIEVDLERIITEHEDIGYERGRRDGYAEAVEEVVRWIPVKEMLPEANGRFLVTRGLVAAGAFWNRVYIANYSDLMGIKSEKIWWQGDVGKSDFKRLDDVVSWMPLPEPWKGEANETD